jgi:hypothetical protein
MAGGTVNLSETKIEAMKLQSSAYGVPIALTWGVTRIAGNMVWCGDFKAVPHSQTTGGKGGGVKTVNTTYSYQAGVVMGLAAGPIIGIPRVWRGKKLYSDGFTGANIVATTQTFTPGVGGVTFTLTHAASFLCITYVTQVGRGDSPGENDILSEGRDYSVTPAGVVTFSGAALYGRAVVVYYQYTASAIDLPNAAALVGLTLVTGSVGQAAWSGLATHGTESIGYSGLALVAGQDYDLGPGAQIENHNFEVVGPLAYHLGGLIPDVDPSRVMLDLLSNGSAGVSFPASQLADWADWSAFCVASGLLVSPAITKQEKAADILAQAAKLTNTGVVWSSGRLKMIPYADTSATANSVTFTPNTTPVYNLDDDCWIAAPGDAALRHTARSPADRFNHIRVEYLDRSNQYAPAIAEAKDQADIDTYGLRSQDVVQAHWICESIIARKVAQILLQRSLYVVSEYEAILPWHFALLEPMDLVTLTDAGLGLATTGARVTVIEEDEDGFLSMTFEDASSVSSAATYPSQSSTGYQADYNVAPGNVNAPAFFESPADWSSTGLEVGVAVSGAGANWGGCQVWVSLDGTNYKSLGTVYGAARFGTLSAAASAGATSIAVQGLASPLYGGSASDAGALNTLCFVGGANPEFFAFQNATLTAAGAYTLSPITHAAYGSQALAHASGAPFIRLDERVITSGPLDILYVGKTISFKFLSFNLTGGGQQALGDVSPYTYTVLGYGAAMKPGAAGKGLRLRSSATTFQINSSSVASPASITLTALRTGVLEGAVTFSVQAGTLTLTGSGDSRSIDPASMTTDSATVRASVTDALTTYFDDVTIAKVRDGTGAAGANGTQAAPVYLYQWGATQPGDPSGQTTYTWASATNASYTGANGWQVTVPANPTTPGVSLWVASKSTTATAGTTSTVVSWAAGFTVAAWAQNSAQGPTGTTGVQTAQPTVYQWAATIPSAPSGSVTYTWATADFGAAPSGWTLTPGASPSAGFTLWGASVALVGSASNTTAALNWGASVITARGYAGSNGSNGTNGTNGTNGSNGSNGVQGASARFAYALVTGATLSSTPSSTTTAGSTSFPSIGTWGGGETWQATSPTPSAGQSVFQTVGVYDPATGYTTWGVPFLSNLKVGNLSAITVNTGDLTLNGALTMTAAGSITAGAGYAAAGGWFAGYSGGQYKFSLGDKLTFDGSTLSVPALSITGQITAAQFGGSVGGGNLLSNTAFNYLSAWDATPSGQPWGWTIISPTVTTSYGSPYSYSRMGSALRVSIDSAGSGFVGVRTDQTMNDPLALVYGGASRYRGDTAYVLSFYARGEVATSVTIDWAATTMTPASELWVQNPTLISGTWQRYVYRFTTDASWDSDYPLQIMVGGAGFTLNLGDTVDFSDVQLELGDVPTAWSTKPGEILPGVDGRVMLDRSVEGTKITYNSITTNEIATRTLTTSNLVLDLRLTNTGSIGAATPQVICSTNYLAGSAGFAIDGDGNAEFNDGLFRGTLKVGTAAVSGSTMTGSGGSIQKDGKWSLGNATTNITFNGSAITVNGPLVTGDNISGTLGESKITPNSLSSGSLARVITLQTDAPTSTAQVIRSGNYNPGVTGFAIDSNGNAEFNSGLFRGSVKVGTAVVSGTGMTGTGGVINQDGTWAMGNASKNITFDGSMVVVNGDLIATGNIVAGAITAVLPNDVAGPVGIANNTSIAYPTGTSVATVAYGPYADNCKLIITAIFNAKSSATYQFGFWLSDGNGHYSPQYATGIFSPSQDVSKQVSWTVDYVAGTGPFNAALIGKGGWPTGLAGAPSLSMADIHLRVEVIKR